MEVWVLKLRIRNIRENTYYKDLKSWITILIIVYLIFIVLLSSCVL